MSWQQSLQSKSRDPVYLWRMVIGIIAIGIIVGWLVENSAQTRINPFEAPAVDAEWDRLETLAVNGEWSAVWWGVPRFMVSDLRHPKIIAMAAFAAVCWLVFLWQVLRISSLWNWRIPATLVAVALGILSIWPTCFLILWQEYRWDLPQSEELIPGLRFFILGVGLREEFSKLVCLLPLLVLLVSKRDEFAVLIVSACVGLGFALEENIGYYLGSQGTAALARFLTANPFHMALTGLIGLHVYRAILDPANWGPQAICVFGVLVFAHGLYDALAVLPELSDFSIGSIVIFALVMKQFFHELRTLRYSGRNTISLPATFLCCVSLLAAMTFVSISAIAGSKAAADALYMDVISLSVMVYLFLREMPDSLMRS